MQPLTRSLKRQQLVKVSPRTVAEITADQWCEQEAERINKDPNRRAIVRRANGLVTVFVDSVEVEGEAGNLP